MALKIRVEGDTGNAQQAFNKLGNAADVAGQKIGKLGTLGNINPRYHAQIREALGISSGPRGATFASASTGEFPIEKQAQKFGAATRQMRQAMSELRPALANYKRDMTAAMAGMQFTPIIPNANVPPIIPRHIPRDSYLRQGANQLRGMGPLNMGMDWKTAGVGGIASLFSPWIGARMLNQAFGGFPGMGGPGGGQGGGGGLVKGIFGAGGMGGFGEWYIFLNALRTAARVLTEEFVAAIKRGSELYTKAAELGTSLYKLGHVQSVFRAIGLPEGAAEKMMASGLWQRGMKMTPQSLGQSVMLGVGQGTIGREEANAILNMSKEVAEAWRLTNAAARQSASTAGDLFRVNFLFGALKAEWNTFWEQFVSIAAPSLELIMESLYGIFHVANAYLELLNKYKVLLGPALLAVRQFAEIMMPNVGRGDKDFTRKIGGVHTAGSKTSWESMGLIVNGGLGGTNYARQTAENTKKIADHIATLLGGPSTTGTGFGGYAFNAP
jgi:hypothetical protein